MKAFMNLLFYPVIFIVSILVMIYKELSPEEGLTIRDASKHAREMRDAVRDIKDDIDLSTEPTTRESA